MKYGEINEMIEDIKLSFGHGAISKVNVMEDTKNKILSVSIITPKAVVIFDKEESLVHKAFNNCINYMIKAKDNKLIISFDIKYI